MRYVKLLSLGAAMALLVSACGGGPSVEAAGTPLGGSIAVHGDWTIEVYNEDGTLEQRQEFSNDFVGGSSLAELLSNEFLHEGWIVEVGSRSGTSPCPSNPFVGACGIGGTWSELGEVLSTSGDQLTLAGSVEATQDGEIDFVSSHLILCPSEGCTAPAFGVAEFTTTDVMDPTNALPYAISSGQIVSIEVTLSFTSG